jgi:hypothetical protein
MRLLTSFRPHPTALGAVLCALLLAPAAHAQLKAPKGTSKQAPGKKAAEPAQPAASAAQQEPATEAVPPEIEAKVQAAGLAAQGWLLLLDRRDWGTAWETSAGMFRGAVPLDKWMDGIPKVRADLGALVDRDAAAADYKTELPGRPVGDYVTLLFTSKFENREVEEIVTTVREQDGRWRVTGYSTR